MTELKKTTGLAALVGGTIVALHTLVHWALYGFPFDMEEVALDPLWTALNAFLLVGMIMLLLGLFGLHQRQAERAGVFGLVAFLVLFVGFTLRTGFVFMEIVFAPTMAREAPHILTMDPPPIEMGVGYLVEMATKIGGLILFGIATIRARVYPRAAGYLVAGGVLVSLVPMVVPLGIAIAASGLAWMGWDHLRAAMAADSPAEGLAPRSDPEPRPAQTE